MSEVKSNLDKLIHRKVSLWVETEHGSGNYNLCYKSASGKKVASTSKSIINKWGLGIAGYLMQQGQYIVYHKGEKVSLNPKSELLEARKRFLEKKIRNT